MEKRAVKYTGRGTVIEMMAVFCLLVSMGFPGQLEKVYGERFGDLMEYGAFLLEIMMMLFSSATRWQDIELLNLKKKYVPIYVYVGVTFALSILVTDYRTDEMITCLRWTVTMLFVIWLQDYFTLEEMLELFGLAQGVFIVITILFTVRYPSLSHNSGSSFTNALCGLYPSKNACATQFCFGILMTALLLRLKIKQKKRYLVWMGLLIVQGALLLLCDATGAIFTLLLSFIPLFLERRGLRLPLGVMYIAVNVLFLFLMLTLMPLFEGFFESIGKDGTLTGRIPLWQQIITVMMEKKTFTGYGYGMFWRDPVGVKMIHMGFVRVDAFMATMTSGAHNVIMETWLNTGLIGIAVFFYCVMRCFRSVGQVYREYYLICATLLFYLMINGLTERCLGDNYDFKTVALFLCLSLSCSKRPPRRVRWRTDPYLEPTRA